LPGFLPYPRPRSAIRRTVSFGLLLSFLVLSLAPTGCAQYRQTALNVSPANDCPDFSRGCQKTVWGLLWGAFYAGVPPKADCGNAGLTEVTVRENPGYFLITFLTLGMVSPKSVEWKCARPSVAPGELNPTSPDTTGGR